MLGLPLLIENVKNEIDHELESILNKNYKIFN